MSNTDNGYNPLRWDCKKQGCFNVKRRPKIEVFAECFPKRINFGDIDGIVEINGKALMLEWKTHNGDLPRGQQIMYERLSKTGDITVLCIVGNAETMECSACCEYFKGKRYPQRYKHATLDDIKQSIRKWVNYAENSN